MTVTGGAGLLEGMIVIGRTGSLCMTRCGLDGSELDGFDMAMLLLVEIQCFGKAI